MLRGHIAKRGAKIFGRLIAMRKIGGSILTYILVFLLIGGVGFLVTNGTRLIGENNSMQKEAKIALEDYVSTGKELPVGEYVSYEVRWVLGPFATETETSTTNGIKATAGVNSYYFLFLDEPGDDLSVMALEVKNAKDIEALDQMSSWLENVDGFPYNGKTLKVQGTLKEMKDTELISIYNSDVLSWLGVSSSDPAVRHLILDTTAGRGGLYGIIFGAAAVLVLAAVFYSRAKKKNAASAAVPATEPVSCSYDPEWKA